MVDHLEVILPVDRRHILHARQLQIAVVAQECQQRDEFICPDIEGGTLCLGIVLRIGKGKPDAGKRIERYIVFSHAFTAFFSACCAQ